MQIRYYNKLWKQRNARGRKGEAALGDKWIDLSGKTVIVTGGSMGIGEAITADLRGCGARVAIFDMAPPKYEIKDTDTMFIKLDIRNKGDVEDAVRQVRERFGCIDALVNNAGVTRPRILVDYYKQRPQYELSEEDFDFMVGVNQKGTFTVTQAVTRVMFEKKDGVIIINDQRIDPITVVTGAAQYPENIIETLKKEHNVVAVDAMAEAKKLGNAKIFNTIIIGVAAKRMDFDKKQWLEVIENTVPPKTIELNKAAFEAGYALV